MIDNAIKDRVRNETEIVPLVEDLTDSTLTASGMVYKTFCPFPGHDEKTPSFTVYPDDGRYYCYGCGLNGDTIDFVREYLALSFVESVQYLGRRLGIEVVDDRRGGERRERQTDIAAVNEAAEEFFAAQPSPEVDQLLTDRNFDAAKVRAEWKIGFSPSGKLIPYLKERGFSLSDMVAAGVAGESDGRTYEFFRNRMMWSIHDQLNRVAGFGARRLFEDDRNPAKFINTVGTELYKKTELLFGLDKARPGIRADKVAVLCEGYTDVLAWHEAGLPYAVASCGTSITDTHVQKIARLVSDEGEIVVGMDGDAAGLKSMLRIMSIVTEYNIKITGIIFPEGMDPDDYRKAYGDEGMRQAFENRTPLVELLINRIRQDYDLSNPESVPVAASRVSKLLVSVKNPILRDHYVPWAARTLNVTTGQIRDLMDRNTKPERERVQESAPARPRFELEILRMAYQKPVQYNEAAEQLATRFSRFTDAQIRDTLAELMWLDLEDESQWREEMIDTVPEELQATIKRGIPMLVLESDTTANEYMRQLIERLDLDYEDRKEQEHEEPVYTSARELLNDLAKENV